MENIISKMRLLQSAVREEEQAVTVLATLVSPVVSRPERLSDINIPPPLPPRRDGKNPNPKHVYVNP
jgi:hypothetical protein